MIKNNKKIYFILSAFSFFVLVLLLVPTVSNALNVDYPPIPTPGGVLDLNDEVNEGRITMSAVIIFVYSAGLWIAGILAFLMLIFAGFAYIVSGANPGQRRRAMEKFKNVLWGFGILLVSSVVLNIINPQIVTIKDPVGLNVDPGDRQFLGFNFSFEKTRSKPTNVFYCKWNGTKCVLDENACDSGYIPPPEGYEGSCETVGPFGGGSPVPTTQEACEGQLSKDGLGLSCSQANLFDPPDPGDVGAGEGGTHSCKWVGGTDPFAPDFGECVPDGSTCDAGFGALPTGISGCDNLGPALCEDPTIAKFECADCSKTACAP